MKNSINQESCIQCKICVDVCPAKIIGINANGFPEFIPEREDICQKCGQCMAVCPSKAILLNGFSYEHDFEDIKKHGFDYDNFTDFLASRRSVRNFKNKTVTEEDIEKIIKAISFAPYGAHPEKMHLTVINNRETIEKALPYASKLMDKVVKLIENPIASFFVKSMSGSETFNTIKNHIYPLAKKGNFKLENGDGISRGAPAIFIFHADKGAEAHTNNALILATYAGLAAHSLGLGATMIEVLCPAINKVKEVKEIFDIPPNHEAVMTLIVGHPKYKFQRIVKRDNNQIHRLN